MVLLEEQTHHTAIDHQKYCIPGYGDPQRLGPIILESYAATNALQKHKGRGEGGGGGGGGREVARYTVSGNHRSG